MRWLILFTGKYDRPARFSKKTIVKQKSKSKHTCFGASKSLSHAGKWTKYGRTHPLRRTRRRASAYPYQHTRMLQLASCCISIVSQHIAEIVLDTSSQLRNTLITLFKEYGNAWKAFKLLTLTRLHCNEIICKLRINSEYNRYYHQN